MKLSVKDRLVFGSLLPRQGSLEAMLIVRELQEKTEISLREREHLNMRDEVPCPQCGRPSQVVWDDKKEKVIDVELTRGELDFLQAQIQKASREERVSFMAVDLCARVSKLTPENERPKKEQPKKEEKVE